MPLRDRQVHRLLVLLRETQDHELDCEQFLAVVAHYAEVRARSQPLPDTLADAAAHERLCANCREECQALVELLHDELTGS